MLELISNNIFNILFIETDEFLKEYKFILSLPQNLLIELVSFLS
jgi:hypothetical protein